MPALKRNQNWPLGLEKGIMLLMLLMQTKGEQILMLGYCVNDYFYTPDIGKDKWEIWNLSELFTVSKHKSA
jgi:hypothetical protein